MVPILPANRSIPTQGFGRRALRALRWGLCSFVLAQLALIGLMERWRPDLRDPSFGRRLAILRYQRAKHPDRPLLLALGTSRAEMGFRPDRLPDYRLANGQTPLLFNFAFAGSFPVQQYLYLDQLLAEGIHPDWLLIEVMPFALLQQGPLDEIVQVDHLAWSDLARLDHYGSQPWPLYLEWALARSWPWFAQRFWILSRHAPAWIPEMERCDYLWKNRSHQGWLMNPHDDDTPGERRRAVRLARKVYADALQQSHVAPLPGQALRDLLDLCRRERIAPVLFLMPEGRQFQSWYAPAVRAEVDAYLARLSREQQVPVIDARNWIADADFSDSHHLLPHGAAVFTHRLGREVIQPLLEKRLRHPVLVYTTTVEGPKNDLTGVRKRSTVE